jgi:hypothetical protein
VSNDADQIVIAGNGTINIAPYGTPLPAEVDSVLHTDFDVLGYTTEDGAKFTDSKTLQDFSVWQEFYPIAKRITARDATVEFSLVEWDRRTIALGFGGGTWTEPSPGSFVYNPPNPQDITYYSVVIDIDDGTNDWRFLLRKATVVSNTESTFARNAMALLPITLGAVGVTGQKPFSIMTDSAAASIAGQGS